MKPTTPTHSKFRERAEKLATSLRGEPVTHERHQREVDEIKSALKAAAAEARKDALDQVLAGIAREQQYHEFLDEKHAEVRHPVLACKEIASYVRALAQPGRDEGDGK